MDILEADLDAEAILLYLGAAGWRAEKSDERRSIWRHISGARVFVPAITGPDFRSLLQVAVREIAHAEERDEADVAVDLAWRQFDKLHLRRSAPSSALPLSDALDLHGALYDLIVAAARAASEPRSSFSGRRPILVEDYLERVKLIPSIPGSFVVRALLPLERSPEQEPLPLVGPAAPDIRRISVTILRASRTAVQAAHDVASGSPFTRWDQAVNAGVSSNLCDALARLSMSSSDTSGDINLRIDWTWAAPSEPAPAVDMPVGLAPVLAAGADYLRGEPEEHTVRLTGLITKLHREAATGAGEITVRGHIENWDSGSRAIRFELDEGSYREAIAAHDEGVSVRVTALVRRTDRGLDVVRIEDLQVLN